MQALILAAGMGKRLGDLTKDNTKCMVRVNGITLIDRALMILTQNILSRIIIVVGYKGDKLKKYLGNQYNNVPIIYVENPIYSTTNNIYSLYLAKKYLLEEDTLLLESDLIFEKNILDRILQDSYPNVVAVAKYESWMDGTVVELDDDGRVSNFINKKSFQYVDKENYYKTVNIYKFSRDYARKFYLPFLEAYIQSLGNNNYYEEVLRVITLINRTGLKASIVENEVWYEIDDIQDLDIAEVLFSTNKSDRYLSRFGGYWRFPKLLDYCYLVNPYFPCTALKQELVSNFDILLTQYPSGLNVNILLLSKILGVNQKYLCVGNGAAELINSLMKNISGRVGVVYPSFEEYSNRYDKQLLVPYILSNSNFSYTVDQLMTYYEEKEINNLLLINPDNPSGNFIPLKDLYRLIHWAEGKGVRLIVDESFVDFSDKGIGNTILKNDYLQDSKLVILKSLSKSHGIPGLRLGVLATGDINLLNSIRKDVSIWNINSFAEYYLQIFDKYEIEYRNACQKFLIERKRFYDALSRIPYLRTIPSQANFFLCEVTSHISSEELVEILLKKYDILVKNCASKTGFKGKSYIRIAIRNEIDNDKLLKALSEL